MISRAHAARLVRVADQPDAALRRHRGASPRPAGRAASSRSSTTRSPARSISSRSRSASIWSMHSATKYLNGHSDVTAGALAGPARADRRRSRRRAGCSARVIDPHAAYALGRGLKTLPVRVERHNANALAVADWLAERPPRRARSTIRACASHPDHAIAAQADDAASAAWCASIVGGGYDRAARVLRPAAGHQARRQPRRRREPVQPAGADVAVGAHRRAARARRRDHRACCGCRSGSRMRTI